MPKRQESEMDPAADFKGDFSSQFKQILDDIHTLQDEGGTRLLVSAFLKLPPKKVYPDYYELIEVPISLAEITKKLQKGSYTTVASFVADFSLMYDNAVLYNNPDSWIVHDAQGLLTYVREHTKTAVSVAVPEPSLDELTQMCTSILDEVIAHEFPEDGVLSGPFIYNVDPDEYPEYYTIIQRPTSFENVKNEMDGSLFSSSASLADNLNAFYNETNLIFLNAQEYNDPSSLIHEDLKKLQALFKEKFQLLQANVLGELHTSLKLKIKPPKETAPKLKLTFKGKPESPGPEYQSGGEEPPKKRRGRKPKRVLEEERLAEAEANNFKKEYDGYPELDGDQDLSSYTAFEHHAMGKHATIPSKDSVFIRRVGFSSNPTVNGQILSAVGTQPYASATKADLIKRSFFPEVPVSTAATLFDYQFETLGYSSKAYTITLPPDSTPIISMKIALHEIIYNLKKDDLTDGQGFLRGRNEEEFMVSFFVNDEEISGGVEISEEIDSVDNRTRLLSLAYDFKLNYGLNIVNFELRLSPSLAKKLRKRKVLEQDSTELAGRHTRHQVQQSKLNWEVEKFTLHVVSLSP